ncbi:MAG: hypothetical protein A3E83_02370 [Gammaproteobacteria bacterium RIFCSPHIGHO2_12_FULL_41_20]|nr:MAG: hypothetical protein A3E83_02370 [Gammaproteobacteria bacterium RIFCSPHIGHO2_12_FULL_41_20]
MSLEYLKISNFRNLLDVDFYPVPNGINFVCGNNGSGKTSFLEAIYYLGLGRSFRTSSVSRIINHQVDNFLLAAQVNCSENSYSIGMERYRTGGAKIRVHGKEAKSTAELAYYLPIRLINSSCHLLLEGGPTFRRFYLDWGLFYHSEAFFQEWRQFNRALKQRNCLLQGAGLKAEIDAWTNELLEYATKIEILRQEYLQALLPYLEKALMLLVSAHSVIVDYYPGWSGDESYAAALRSSLSQDMRLGYTQHGPHRADLRLTIQGICAKDVLSRGQQKLFVCGMIIAQGALLAAQKKRRPVYLIDDLPSELDAISRSKLIALLAAQSAQIFVTAIESESAKDFEEQAELATKMFHVKHGRIISH